MKIGIVGAGNMGASMGTAWAAKGHMVLFSFAKDQDKRGQWPSLPDRTPAPPRLCR